MLKVLYLPLNDATSVQQATYDAFRAVGVDLHICDFHNVWLRTKSTTAVNQDFLTKVKEVRPHLIHMQLQFTGLLDVETLNKAKAICPDVVITNWTGDCRAEAKREFVSIAAAIDHSLISSTGQLDLYRKAGVTNAKYWQIGYEPKNNFPMRKTYFNYDVSFIANNYGSTFPDGKIRSEVANLLRSVFGTRFGLFGSGYDAPITALAPNRMNEVYNDSVCCLSISNFNSVDHYFSDRLLYCVASGRPTIAWRYPGCDSYFVDGKEIIYVSNREEIIEAVNFCKENPKVAIAIGEAGAKRVFREHTFQSRILELLTITNLVHLL